MSELSEKLEEAEKKFKREIELARKTAEKAEKMLKELRDESFREAEKFKEKFDKLNGGV